jgi:hypothetical protein
LFTFEHPHDITSISSHRRNRNPPPVAWGFVVNPDFPPGTQQGSSCPSYLYFPIHAAVLKQERWFGSKSLTPPRTKKSYTGLNPYRRSHRCA